MTYDSKAEENVAQYFENLGYRRPLPREYINATLADSTGEKFDAKFDFIPNDPDDCTVEFKCGPLNSKTTKAIADKDFANARLNPRQGQTMRYIEIANAWSNSVYKHGIQHRALPPLSHITVLAHWPEYEQVKLFIKEGILFCHITQFETLNSYCKAARLGLPLTYIIRTPDGQQVKFPLTSILNGYWKSKTASKKEWLDAGFISKKQKKRYRVAVS